MYPVPVLDSNSTTLTWKHIGYFVDLINDTKYNQQFLGGGIHNLTSGKMIQISLPFNRYNNKVT